MVIQSSSKPLNNAIFITEIKDRKSHNLIAPIDVDTTGMYNNVQIDANQISTIFGKNNFSNFIDKLTSNDILLIDKEKAVELYKVQGRQLPNQLNNLNGFIHSVRKSNQKVNYQTGVNYSSDMQIMLEKFIKFHKSEA